MLRVKSVHLLPLIVALSMASAAQAQSTGVGKRGLYGKSSVEEEGQKAAATPAGKPAENAPPLTEEQKRLLQKYPLSVTSKTATNQKANEMMQKGILYYNQTRALFEAANKITSTYDTTDAKLEVTQQGIIQSRLQPADLLLYGPENAFIGLRVRALQEADRAIGQSIASFSQAQALAPFVSAIPKWLRVTRDTQKAIRYHIRFYQLSLKAIKMGYTDKELGYMAERWNAPLVADPSSTLTTRVNTALFENTRKQVSSKGETPDIESFLGKLPSLDFKVQ